jgi:hypothetical protein
LGDLQMPRRHLTFKTGSITMTSPTPQTPEQQGPYVTPPQGAYTGHAQAGYASPMPAGSPQQGYGGYPQPVIPQQRMPFETHPAPARRRGGAWKVVLAGFIGLVLGIMIGSSGSTTSPNGGTSTTGASSNASPQAPQAAPAQPQAPSTPAGPLTTLAPGTYEVGSAAGDAMPGQYKASGPDGSNPAGCYYARLKQNDGSVDDILSNDVSQGPALFTLKPSDGYIQIEGCTFSQS